QLLACVGAAFACELADPALETPALGLERERLRVALGQRVLHACKRRRLCAQELFDLFLHCWVPCPGRARFRLSAGAERLRKGRAAHLPAPPAPPAEKARLDSRAMRVRAAVAALLVALAAPAAAAASLQARLDRALEVPYVSLADTGAVALDL